MATDRLSALQRDLLRALSRTDTGFFLTGGGVLVGFVLGHRTTDDLDLFTTDDAVMSRADSLARTLAAGVRKTLGRPRVNTEIRKLIKRMAGDNIGWGAPRIHGELLKLGFSVSEATVSRYMPRHRSKPPSQTWRTFLRNHMHCALASDRFLRRADCNVRDAPCVRRSRSRAAAHFARERH